MNNKWSATKSNTRIALGLTFMIAGFVWTIYFFMFQPFSVLDRLTGWFGAIVGGAFLFLGVCIGFTTKLREITIGFMVLVAWSLGLALLPVPQGYGEAVFGGWFLVLFAMVALYEKHRKKGAHYGGGAEEE